MEQDAADLDAIAAIYAALEKDAVKTLRRDGIEDARMRVAREADIRYAGQSMEVRVAAPAGRIDALFLARLVDAFHAAHLRTRLAPGNGAMPAPRSWRPVYFDYAPRETPIYDRAALTPGLRLVGPAVIEEFGSTTVVFPGQDIGVDPHGILIVRTASRELRDEGARRACG
jgi:N-methylhydantoinase A